ncbi:hypothetical protein Tco_0853209 [Tanacetum coccineum]
MYADSCCCGSNVPPRMLVAETRVRGVLFDSAFAFGQSYLWEGWREGASRLEWMPERSGSGTGKGGFSHLCEGRRGHSVETGLERIARVGVKVVSPERRVGKVGWGEEA